MALRPGFREPTANELQKAWGSRNTSGVNAALEKVNKLLHTYEESDADVSSPEVSPDKSRFNRVDKRQSSTLRGNRKEFSDWSAASIFSDGETQKKEQPQRFVQSPFKKFEPSPIPSFEAKSKGKLSPPAVSRPRQNRGLPVLPPAEQSSRSRPGKKTNNSNRSLGISRNGKDVPHGVIKKAIKEILHRNSRDVTIRSLRLQLQMALGADFSKCSDRISKIVDEINGVGSAKEDAFLKELLALKKAREKQQAEAVVEKKSNQPEKKNNQPVEASPAPAREKADRPKPVKEAARQAGSSNSTTAQRSAPTTMESTTRSSVSATLRKKSNIGANALPDFQMRLALGLLTHSEKQQMQESAAVRIQCQVRRMLAKLEMKRQRELVALHKRANEIRRGNSATSIQSQFRSSRERKKYLKKVRRANRSSATIQRLYRGWSCRRRLQENQTMKASAAVTIQRIARGLLSRKMTKAIEQQRDGAAKIQKLVRGRQDRKRIRQYHRSATRLQCQFRSFQVQKQLQQKHTSAQKIQALARKHRERRRFAESKKQAVKIQGSIRGYRARIQLAREKSAALSIQRVLRGHKARKFAAGLSDSRAKVAQEELIKHSVTIVQRHVRGFQTRQNKTRLVRQRAEENRAATNMQRLYRGYSSRKEYIREKAKRKVSIRQRVPVVKQDGGAKKIIKAVGYDLPPKVRTAGFDHVKRFREAEKFPKVQQPQLLSRERMVSSMNNPVQNNPSLPSLAKNNLANPQWGRKNRIGRSGKIITRHSKKMVAKQSAESDKPRWGNNFGIRNQYGLNKS